MLICASIHLPSGLLGSGQRKALAGLSLEGRKVRWECLFPSAHQVALSNHSSPRVLAMPSFPCSLDLHVEQLPMVAYPKVLYHLRLASLPTSLQEAPWLIWVTLLVMFFPAGTQPPSFLFLKMIIDSLPRWRDGLQWIDVGDWGKSREWQGAIVSTVFVVELWLHRDAWGRVDARWIFSQLSPWLLVFFWLVLSRVLGFVPQQHCWT